MLTCELFRELNHDGKQGAPMVYRYFVLFWHASPNLQTVKYLTYAFLVLLLLGGFLTLVIGTFYIEENARGAHEWEITKQKILQADESIDFNNLIPPPVADSENLASIPLFETETDASKGVFREPLALKKALAKVEFPGRPLPKAGNWVTGEKTDMVALREYFSELYKNGIVHLTNNQADCR